MFEVVMQELQGAGAALPVWKGECTYHRAVLHQAQYQMVNALGIDGKLLSKASLGNFKSGKIFSTI